MLGKTVSPRLEKLEKEFIANGGEWKEYHIGRSFDIQTGSLVNNAYLFEGEIQRISAKSTDNGVIGSFDTDYLEDARHYENFISVNFFGDVFYHPYRASVEMKVHVLHLHNHSFTRGTGLYISATIRQALKNKFGYGNQLSSTKLKNEEFYISLPSLSEQIAFSFMERYIEELEAERIEELEAYLEATRLKNYALNADDVKSLNEFEQISSILPPPQRK